MSSDYLPGKDADYQVWLANFVSVATTNKTALGLTVAQVTDLASDQGAFNSALTAQVLAAGVYHGSTQTKNEARQNATADVRMLVRLIQGNPAVTPALKEQLRINPGNTPRTDTPPAQPLDLVVTPDINGINNLKWNGNGNKEGTTYQIEAQEGTTGPFSIVATTTKKKFAHTGQTLGAKVTYRIVAVRADMESVPSLPVTAYANGPGLTLLKAA